MTRDCRRNTLKGPGWPALVILLTLSLVACPNRTFGPSDAGTDADAADVAPEVDVRPDAEGAREEVGEPCSGPSQCVDGAYCIGVKSGGFRCMRRCDVAYSMCDDGSVCLPIQTREDAICYTGGDAAEQASCQENIDCMEGLLCFGTGADFYCRRACDSTGNGCGDEEFCQILGTGAGLCRSRVGTSCQTDAQCASPLRCSSGLDAAWDRHLTSGYCSVPGCVDDTACPRGSVCRRVPDAEDNICLATCDHVSDCRFNGGYRCLDASACDAWPDPAACRTTFGNDSICIVAP